MKTFLKTIMYVISWFFCLIPRRGHLVIANTLGIIWFDILKFRRKVVLDNLNKAFPKASNEWRIHVGRKSVQNLCLSILDYFVLMHLNKKNLHKIIEFQDMHYMDEQLRKKVGVLAMSLHMGTIDLAPAGLALKGYPLSITLKKINNPSVNAFIEDLRKSKGVNALADRRNPFEIFRAIKRNDLTVFVMDQYMGRPHGILIKFFGLDAGTASGLAGFSLKTGLPVIPMYNFRLANGKIVIRSEPPLMPETISEDFDENIRYNTQKYNDKIEEIVKRHPEQWMWVHRRWKEYS